jgi:hypothetical protein
MPQLYESERERTNASIRNVTEAPGPDAIEGFGLPELEKHYWRFWEGVLDMPRVFRLINPADAKDADKRFAVLNNFASLPPGGDDTTTNFCVDWFFEAETTDKKTRLKITERIHPFLQDETGSRIFSSALMEATDFLEKYIPVDYTDDEWKRTLKKHAEFISREKAVLKQASRNRAATLAQREKLARPLSDQIAESLAALVKPATPARP